MNLVLDDGSPSPEMLVEQAGRRAKGAAPTVARLSTSVKNEALHDLAAALLDEGDSILEALALLKEHARRDDLAPPVLLTDEDDEEPVGAAGSGVNRVMRLDQVDYAAAEEEYFTIQAVEPASLTLHSKGRAALGEGPAGPVSVPPRAAELLRADDIIHAEIAPGPQGWELLEAFGIRPGGYA